MNAENAPAEKAVDPVDPGPVAVPPPSLVVATPSPMTPDGAAPTEFVDAIPVPAMQPEAPAPPEAGHEDRPREVADGPSASERRRMLRIPSVLPIDFQLRSRTEEGADAEVRTGTTRDISATGLKLQISHLPPPLGAPLATGNVKDFEIALDIPLGDRTVRVRGALAWSKLVTSGSRQHLLVGVQFLDIDDSDAEELVRFAKKMARRPRLVAAAAMLMGVVAVASAGLLAWNEVRHRGAMRSAQAKLTAAVGRYDKLALDMEAQTRELGELARKTRALAPDADDEMDLAPDSASPLDELEAAVASVQQTLTGLNSKLERMTKVAAERKAKGKGKRGKRKAR